MAKNGRFLENLIHDIPIYPFSSSPDGRIVGEINRSREEQKRFHEKVLAAMTQGQREIAKAHGGVTRVTPDRCNSGANEKILGDVFHAIQNASFEHRQTTSAVYETGQATARGIHQLHDDLGGIKGPSYPRQNLSVIMEDDRDFFGAMCAYSKNILSIDAYDEFRQLFQEKMEPMRKFIPGLEDLLEGKIQQEQLRRQAGQSQGQPGMTPPLKTLYDFPHLCNALNFFKNPLVLLDKSRGEVAAQMGILLDAAETYEVPELNFFVGYIDRFFASYRHAQQTPVPEEMLVKMGQNELLNPVAQHQVLQAFSEARVDGNLANMNFSLLDLVDSSRKTHQAQNVNNIIGLTQLKVQQGLFDLAETQVEQGRQAKVHLGSIDEKVGVTNVKLDEVIGIGRTRVQQGAAHIRETQISNYHLATISGNLTRVHGGIIDLTKVVEDFAEMVEEGLEEINDTLIQGFGMIDHRLAAIQTEMVLTRTAVVSELQNLGTTMVNVGTGIIFAIDRVYQVLEQMAEIAKESHKNEARQYFEDGMGCFKNAEDFEHLEEAYSRFSEGIKAHAMTVENHYGAGLTSELLGKLEQAKKHYKTSVARCSEQQQQLKSHAQEGLARTEYKMGNLPEAVAQSKAAFETDPSNNSALYSQAHYLLLQGFVDEAVIILKALLQKNPEWYVKVKTGGLLGNIPQPKLIKFYEDLTANKSGSALKLKVQILDDILTLEQKNLAINIIMYLLEIRPMELLVKKIWLHPNFHVVYDDLKYKIHGYVHANLQSLSAKTCYELTILLHCLKFPEEVLVAVLQTAINQDPQMYSGGVELREKIIHQKLAAIGAAPIHELNKILAKVHFPPA